MIAATLAALRGLVLVAAAAAVLTGCTDEQKSAAIPPPAEVADAIGHYCGMQLAEHAGPKGQIHLKSGLAPVWFSSVRDTIAFMRLPEEPRDIVAVYVNDMARAKNWDQPEDGTWVEINNAWFVIGSDRLGGMGAQEAIPFGGEAAAQDFQAEHGGRVVRLDDIQDEYIFGTGAEALAPATLAADPQVVSSHAGH